MELRWLCRWEQQMLAVLRIVAGLLFVEHATVKLFAFPTAFSTPGPLPTLLLAAAVIELLTGPLIVAGLFVRPAAFLASGEMAVGYFIYHFPRSFWPAVNEGDSAILFCFIFLFIAAAGPGSFSLSRARPSPPDDAPLTPTAP